MAVKTVVCFKCAVDPYLSRQIQRSGTSTLCSLCALKRRCIPLSEIVSRVEGILDKYVYEGEVTRRWSDGSVTDSQSGDTIDYWVSEIFDCDNVEPIVVAVCSNLTGYSNDLNYQKSAFRPDDLGYDWGKFQEGMKHGNRFFNEGAKVFLDWIFKGLDKYSASSDEHAVVRVLTPENAPPIFRARTCMTADSVCEITADPARNLAAPPKERAGEGRMNPAGVPAFYGAFDRKTCMAELRPPVGGTVVSGEFRLNREVTVLDFGRFEKADLGPKPSFFEPKSFQKMGRRSFLTYLHNEITIPVLPGSERNYLIPQVIAEYLYTHCKPKMDGLIFKSVQNPAGSNIVLFSHVACAPTSMMWQLNGVHTVLGPVHSDAPRIEYVPGSLIHHSINGVDYDDRKQPLRDDAPKVEAAANKEW